MPLNVNRIYHNSAQISLHLIQDGGRCNSQDDTAFILQVRAHQAFRYFSIAWPGWRVRYPVRYPSRCEWQIVIHQVLAVDFGILYQAREVDDAPMHLVRARTLNAESRV